MIYSIAAQLAHPDFTGDTVSSDLLIRVLVALGIGILIGMEREFAHKPGDHFFAGIRTYSFVTLWGFLSAFLSIHFTPWLFIVSCAGIVALSAIAYVLASRNGDIGGTSELSVIIAFLLGGLVFTGKITLAIGIAVVVTALLSLKIQLQAFIGKLTIQDIHAILKFIVITVLVLPFLPTTAIGPYPFLVPRDIWLMVVLVASVSFAGYLLAKFISARKSIVLTGLIGSMVSSTAVTMEFSRKSAVTSGFERDYAAGIIFASSIMFLRVLVLIFLINRSLFSTLLLPLGACAVAGLLAGAFIMLRTADNSREADNKGIEVKNPLDLIGAIKFGAVYLGILFLVHFISDFAGDQGVYIAGAISGITDVDAISISMSKLAGASIVQSVAHATVIIATLSNSVVKYGISLIWGAGLLRRYTSIGFGAIITCGVAALLISLF